MLNLQLAPRDGALAILCLGAHSDDIEIGSAGTLLRWLSEYRRVAVTWCVLSAPGVRAVEARRSAQALLRRAESRAIVIGDFTDGLLPAEFVRAKAFLADLRAHCSPDVIFTHGLSDRHQDHRIVAELTWQLWRNHLILEYEIPKYEGDLGQPNAYVSLSDAIARRKVDHLLRHFSTQRGKAWFTPETFRALMCLRGIEAGSASHFAEAFHLRKGVL